MLGLINNYLVKIIAIIALLFTHVSVAYDTLDYQRRSDRWEDIAPRPVSGLDIELLSALVAHHWQSTPPQCKLTFYLPNATEVDWLRVQELHPRHFYKMEPMISKQPWHQGFNDYQWTE
ncbi:MAG: hypothetical protein DRR19_18420 [Candidatus Parabeggiatoa sp. nov. 1]|nr:MAG: hypothetical protein DRR19_18420 [Gammaproteobacteria bacterium]